MGRTRKKREMTPEEKAADRKKTLKVLRNFLIKIGIIILAVYVIFTYFIAARICHSNDMYPSVKDGDLLLLTRTGIAEYLFDDVVVYEAEGSMRFGRIIAVPGDEVMLDGQGLLVNGSFLYSELPFTTAPPEGSQVEYPLTVPEGEYFILGDLREQALDSRAFGCIPEENITGKTFFIFRHRGF